ncbi:MAG: hypothetical protein HZB91_10270 [Elusimicrobia bacterium]|nr:hypothetical protein [Elusimicrobiota bacterium]
MQKPDFIAQLDRAASITTPLNAAVLGHLSKELKKGDPPWWVSTAKAWEKRSFVAWDEAWTLFLTCLHFEALNNADNPLVPYFPSCGGTDEADPSVGLSKFLADPPSTFFENLQSGARRAFVPLRSVLWTAPAALFFLRRGLSFYLVETDAGAGLHLVADLLYPPKKFDSSFISARIGLDTKPLEMHDIYHRRWITAGLLPDNLKGITGELDKAVEFVMATVKDDPSFLQLVPCPSSKAMRFIAKNIPADDPEVGILFMNMGVTCRMSDAGYADFSRSVAETLAPWGDRGLWIEVEAVRGELYSTTCQLRLHRIKGAGLATMVMASIDLSSGKILDHPGVSEFLSFPKPPAKKK